MARQRGVNFKETWNKIKKHVYKTYSATGVDYLEETVNGKSAGFKRACKKIESPLTLISSFFGLPNKPLQGYEQSFKNLYRNFIGWKPRTANWKLFFYAVFNIPVNLLLTPIRFTLNVARLVTEVLPMTLKHLVPYVGTKLARLSIHTASAYRALTEVAEGFYHLHMDDNNGLIAVLAGKLGWLLLQPIIGLLIASTFLLEFTAVAITLVQYPLQAVYFVGRSITSPVEALRNTWKQASSKGLVVGILLTSLHAMFILVLYTMTFPFIGKFLAAHVLPYLATHLPAGIVSAANAIAHFLSPIFLFIGKFTSPIVNILTFSLFHALGVDAVIASAAPAAAGLAAVAALIVAGTTAVISYLSGRGQTAQNEQENNTAAQQAQEVGNSNNAMERLGLGNRPALEQNDDLGIPPAHHPSPLAVRQVPEPAPAVLPQAPTI
ncbi:hypothetical protein ACFORL_10500 [Legionella dresdenensis]|uniref:Transmembrane protein n=1 Tax=Legionella dresdenensis TaxID=450200 RepID=A0ABV8CGV4_9GAMM